MKIGLRGTLALGLALLLGGCGISNRTVLAPIPEPTTGGSGGTTATSNPDFTGTILPIIQANCTPCHVSGGSSIDLSQFANIQSVLTVGNPDASDIVQHLEGTKQPQMPLGAAPLPQATIDQFRTWIQNGAVETTP